MSNIQWTDETWNPVTGCDKVSAGCKNCYAGRLAETRLKHRLEYQHGFYGNVICHRFRLEKPLHWLKPRMVFVNSMSDLFHESISFDFIAAIFGIMHVCSQHTFQVLTKRPKRMLDFFNSKPDYGSLREWFFYKALDYVGAKQMQGYYPWDNNSLHNIWLGVSCEDQKTADERIPILLHCPAITRFLSVEPLLEPIELKIEWFGFQTGIPGTEINWVIVGGESGHQARYCDAKWIRGIVRQCRTGVYVPVFVKQLGSHSNLLLNDTKGGDMSEFPIDLQVRQFPK